MGSHRATKIILMGLLALGIGLSQVAYADDDPLDDPQITNSNWDNFENFLEQSTFNGQLRMYDFTRDYSSDKANQSAFSLGGLFNFQTAPFWGGFGLGASFYTANPLGLNSDNSKFVDETLPGDTVNALGQAYVQYQNHLALVRVGDQLINTPWLNAADSRMIPATYQGAYTDITPITGLQLIALDIWAYKSRTASSFSSTNLYNSQNIGGIAVDPLGNQDDNGALALGASYQHSNLTSQAWYYQFYDYAKLVYGDAQYNFFPHSSYSPVLGVQLANENGDGDNTLNQFGLGVADANIFGGMLGLNIPNGLVSVAYDDIPSHDGAFNNGDLISPYTAGYASDPLYTTSMIAGLVEKSAGEALKFSANYFLLHRQLQLTGSYAKYYTQPYTPDTTEIDFDGTYNFTGYFKGFALRDRIGILNGNPSFGRFVYNRVMVQYNF